MDWLWKRLGLVTEREVIERINRVVLDCREIVRRVEALERGEVPATDIRAEASSQ